MVKIRAVCVAMMVLLLCGACAAQKANDWAINNAMIGPDSPIEVPAGSSYQAQVAYPVPDGPLYPLKAKVAWAIEPAVKGISIDPGSGKITVQAEVAHGTSAMVLANVDNGRRKLTAKLYVFRPEVDPLIGSWSVDSKVVCGQSGEMQVPKPPLSALTGLEWKFHADGQFWIGRAMGIAARIFLSGEYVLDGKGHMVVLNTKWPPNKQSSRWSYAVKENGAKLLLRPLDAEYGSASGCSYILERRP